MDRAERINHRCYRILVLVQRLKNPHSDNLYPPNKPAELQLLHLSLWLHMVVRAARQERHSRILLCQALSTQDPWVASPQCYHLNIVQQNIEGMHVRQRRLPQLCQVC